MIEIKYEIFEDDKEELGVIDLVTFDEEYGEIYGLFTITVGEQNFIPYPRHDYPLSAKRIYSELILTHFGLLNAVVKMLSNNDYVALKYKVMTGYGVEMNFAPNGNWNSLMT